MPGTSGSWWASTASGSADALRAHGADVVVNDLAELLGAVVIRHRSFPCEPWAVRETELRFDELAQRESVFALVQRPHRAARQPRRGGAVRAARHVPGGLLRVAPAPYAESAATAIPRRGRRSSTSPTARSSGCSSRTSRSTSATASSSSHERVLDLRAGVLRRELEWSSPARTRVRVTLDAAGVVRPAGGRGDRATRSSRSTGRRPSSCSPSWWPTRSCRWPRTIRARPPRSASPLQLDVVWAPRRPGGADAHDQGQRADDRRRDGPRLDGPDGHRRRRSRRFADVARLTVTRRIEHRASRCDGQVPRLRMVGSPLDAGDPRPGGRGAGGGAPHRLGGAARASSARTSTTSGNGADVEVEGDAELQQAVRFAPVSHAPGGRPRRAARDRAPRA